MLGLSGMAHRYVNKFFVQGLLVLVLTVEHISSGYMFTTANTITLTDATIHGTTSTTIKPSTNHPSRSVIHESLVVPVTNSEREAKDLYDKALKQYESYGATARQMCTIWESRGCQCSGSVEELTLACRGAGLNEIPLDLSLDIVKL